jgi:hypothetical protein
MPAPRRQAKACRVRMRQWVAPGVAFVGMLVFICIACHRTWGVGPDPLAEELRETTDRISDSGRTIGALQKQLVATRWKLDTFRGVGQQPDWSVVLSLLADTLGSEAVLKSCELNETTIQADTNTGPRGGAEIPVTSVVEEQKQVVFVLGVSGFGRSQTAVSQFVLRLERSGLFDNVRIVRTTREPFLNGKAIAFRLECRLGGASKR